MRKIPGKIAAINDLSGYGRCSLSVMMPVISACGYQCCPVPTAVLSSSNDFKHPFVCDMTCEMPSYIEKWEDLRLNFEGIYTGYLNSYEQIDSVLRFLSSFKKENTVLLVDPVFGDNGKLSPRCNDELLRIYGEIIKNADIITPNLTEAMFLAGIPYEECPSEDTIDEVAKRLFKMGTRSVIITGLKKGELCCTYIYEGKEKSIVSAPLCPQERTGTGDMFASIVLSKYLDGLSLKEASQEASSFISLVLQFTYEHKVPQNQGICFEPYFYRLSPYYNASNEKENF